MRETATKWANVTGFSTKLKVKREVNKENKRLSVLLVDPKTIFETFPTSGIKEN